jgi:hypothetical protein
MTPKLSSRTNNFDDMHSEKEFNKAVRAIFKQDLSLTNEASEAC